MSTFLTLAQLKEDMPDWEKYARFNVAETEQAINDRLQQRIDDAEVQLLEYLPGLTPGTITNALERHLRIVTRKNVFDIKHGNAKFETKPQIVRDYEQTRDMLEQYKDGGFSPPAADGDLPAISMKRQRPRRFRTWFTRDDTDL